MAAAVGFAEETFAVCFPSSQVGLEGLDGHRTFERHVLGLEDDAHSAGAENSSGPGIAQPGPARRLPGRDPETRGLCRHTPRPNRNPCWFRLRAGMWSPYRPCRPAARVPPTPPSLRYWLGWRCCREVHRRTACSADIFLGLPANASLTRNSVPQLEHKKAIMCRHPNSWTDSIPLP